MYVGSWYYKEFVILRGSKIFPTIKDERKGYHLVEEAYMKGYMKNIGYLQIGR